MQIDFHHAVTYICARLAGFPADEANIVAHSAQYVDDATAAGEVWFDNGMIFPRTASAHKMLDYKNMDELANHRVWLPFHFLPGNDAEAALHPAPHYGEAEFMRRCICRPNSHPAREMMRAVIQRHDRPYALYRLGIATHTFMDTWAHRGFIGYQHRVNVATDIEANDGHHARSFMSRLQDFWQDNRDRAVGRWVGKALPLGHGAVLSYPDRPYLRWSYNNGLGERVERDNPRDFLTAAQETYRHFRRYRDYPTEGDSVFDKTYPLPEAFHPLGEQILTIDDEAADARHARWLGLIESGVFGFADRVAYVDKGAGSWKALALRTLDDVAEVDKNAPLPYPDSFLNSHWKLFHDALQAQKFFVLHELLPRYGLLSG